LGLSLGEGVNAAKQVRLTTYLRLGVRLRMREAITLLLLYFFKTWRGTNLSPFFKPLSSYASIFMVPVSFVNAYRMYPYLVI
jgi:hypothetical protein